MIIHDQKNSWKGLLWSLFLGYPIVVVIIILNFDFNKATNLQNVGILMVGLSNLLWLYILVKQIKKRI
jgi:hypothetical protein